MQLLCSLKFTPNAIPQITYVGSVPASPRHDSSFGSPNEMAKNIDDEEFEVDLDVDEMTLPILTVHIRLTPCTYNNVFTKLCT